MKYIAIGGTERGYKTLLNLIQRDDVTLAHIIIMPGYEDEIESSKKILNFAKTNGISYDYSDKINSNIIERVKKINPKLILGIGIWRSYVPEEFLKIPYHGYLGLHATPLPRYRGAAGIAWQIINGEDKIMAHALKLNNRYDAGQLILKDEESIFSYEIDIQNNLHLPEILLEYDKIHIKFCNEILSSALNGNLKFIDQDESKATYTCFRGPDDGHINWKGRSKDVFNFIRAQSSPYPGAFSYYNGEKIIIERCKINNKLKNYVGRIPGKIVERDRDSGSVSILTIDGGIDIIEIRVDKKIKPFDFFKSIKTKLT
tara:strand:+ start:23 stop:967 length:945 start_codon:yes stop_codon:yes gene_type:complete